MAVVRSAKKPIIAFVLVLVVLWYMVLYLPRNESVVYLPPTDKRSMIPSSPGSSSVMSSSIETDSVGKCALNVTIHVESFDWLNSFYPGMFSKIEETITDQCVLPRGSKCIVQHSDTKSDVLFRMVYKEADSERMGPMKYSEDQLLAVLNSEADSADPLSLQMQQLALADIRISYHPSSHVFLSDICYLPLEILEQRTPPDPKNRKGIALFLSDCRFEWRTQYIRELMEYVHIDSYGLCFHNVPEASSRNNGIDRDGFVRIVSKYRMVVTFENSIQTDYMSEKIGLALRSGAIPVYWGPPEIYSWVPGDHSFIDASRFFGPKELAAYLKKVDASDELFRYHTTNFDLAKSWRRLDELCVVRKEPYLCKVCRIAYQKKSKTHC